MEAKANISYSDARVFTQAIVSAHCLRGCLYSALDCLSGKLNDCIVFSPCFVHDRRFTLYPGKSNKDIKEISPYKVLPYYVGSGPLKYTMNKTLQQWKQQSVKSQHSG